MVLIRLYIYKGPIWSHSAVLGHIYTWYGLSLITQLQRSILTITFINTPFDYQMKKINESIIIDVDSIFQRSQLKVY
jgi:hypothetical protein